jgi:hypothetical protein
VERGIALALLSPLLPLLPDLQRYPAGGRPNGRRLFYAITPLLLWAASDVRDENLQRPANPPAISGLETRAGSR